MQCIIFHNTIICRAVMTWLAKWLAEVYLPSTRPKSNDISIRYFKYRRLTMIKSLTVQCLGSYQLWNCLLPPQTPISPGMRLWLQHLVCHILSLTLHHFDSLAEACKDASANCLDCFSSLIFVLEQNSWKLVHLDSEVYIIPWIFLPTLTL
jgi:hypothetical protein